MSQMRAATARQVEVLRAINGFVAANGFPPTIRELGALIGVSSLRGVTVHLESLERKGMLWRDMARARCMRITEAGMGVILEGAR
jgi:repressor LexA